MIVTCVYVAVIPEGVDEFIKETVKNHRESVKEPGNLRFDLIQESGNPSRFMIYEAYESEAAAAMHKQTPHYVEWRDRVSGLMAEPRTGVRYNIIEPSDKALW
ncbi:MAG: antibiotic biosynthesis monooxygenase [Bacteroidales bacterium]